MALVWYEKTAFENVLNVVFALFLATEKPKEVLLEKAKAGVSIDLICSFWGVFSLVVFDAKEFVFEMFVLSKK